ncbi:hypothetical protein D3C87_1440710 [compost metagenome]
MPQFHERLEVFLEFPRPDCVTLTEHQQGKRPLAPLRIGDPHHCYFTYRRMTTDQVFQVQGGDPLATGLDHVLDPVTNVDHAHAVQGRHVTGVQPASGPELGALLRLIEIPLGQPRRA